MEINQTNKSLDRLFVEAFVIRSCMASTLGTTSDESKLYNNWARELQEVATQISKQLRLIHFDD